MPNVREQRGGGGGGGVKPTVHLEIPLRPHDAGAQPASGDTSRDERRKASPSYGPLVVYRTRSRRSLIRAYTARETLTGFALRLDPLEALVMPTAAVEQSRTPTKFQTRPGPLELLHAVMAVVTT